jgi:hypothetical protein
LVIVVNQRAMISVTISSRALSSLGTNEHENGFARLESRNVNLCKVLEKNQTPTLGECP